MNISFNLGGIFSGLFGRKKKAAKQEEPQQPGPKMAVNIDAFTPEVIKNVCDQCGVFERHVVSEETKQKICLYTSSWIHENFAANHQVISECFVNGFKNGQVALSNDEAAQLASAFLESYVYNNEE